MDKYAAQTSDSQNSGMKTSATKRDFDLKVTSLGSLQKIAQKDQRGQQHESGRGATPVDAKIR